MTEKLIAKRYLIQEKLGAGGMGTVFKGLDTQTNQTVAIKQLKPELTDIELIERFKREGEALRDLDHPNIVKMLDAIEEGGSHYLMMEYVGGGDLKTLLEQNGKLDHKRCVDMAIDLADALTRAHRLNIIHRDLKPANVLIGEDDVLRLTDFGVAHVVDKERVTETDAVVGTLDYLSPEALNGEQIDTRADIWAFGVMLFEMLTGKRPFRGGHNAALMMNILTQPAPDLEQLCSDAPIALVNLIYRMLEKDPSRRIPSVRQVGAELEAILQGTPIPKRFAAEAFLQPVEMVEAPESTTPHNLPAQPTRFIGRKREIDAVISLLQQHENVRLVTLTGVGGTGKTRLSIEVASQLLEQYPDGVYFVALESITEPDGVLTTISTVLKAQALPDETPLQSIIRTLRTKHAIIILDNFEQVVAAAPLIGDIIAGTEKLKVIVSSREVLHITGEHAFPVPPLGMPEDALKRTAEVYAEYEAIRLFVDCAAVAKRDFVITDENAPIIADICIRLDGLPLAISLVAARSRMFTPQKLLDRLSDRLKNVTGGGRDLPARQRTLRGAIDWSYDLLDEDEKRLFARLGVFKGGWSIEAAEEVCSHGLGLDVIDGLESLMDKSLIIPIKGVLDNPRFTMLETIREYAEDKLNNSGESDDIRNAHLGYWVRWFAEEDWSEIYKRADAKISTDRVQSVGQEYDNISNCIEWGLKNKKHTDILSICLQLFVIFGSTYAPDLIRWMEAGIESSNDLPEQLYADTLNWLAWMLNSIPGKKKQAYKYAESAVAIFQAINDEFGVSNALNTLAATETDLDKRIQLFEQSLEYQRKLKNDIGVGAVTCNMAEVYRSKANLETARTLAQEAIDLFSGPMHGGFKRMCTLILTTVEMHDGNYAQAHQLINELMPENSTRRISSFAAMVYSAKGFLALFEDDLHKAYIQFRDAIEILREVSEVEQLLELLEGVAYILSRIARWEQSATLFGAVFHFREQFMILFPPVFQPVYERHLSAVKDNLDEATFDARWAEGTQMTLEEAMNFASDVELG